MGREVRRVPANWQHPVNSRGEYIPLLEGYANTAAEYIKDEAAWNRGERPDCCSALSARMSYREWAGNPPERNRYMPDWDESAKTHLQMYETCTEGTPISPVMATAEELARWLFENKASAFASQTASYESWLATIRRGWAPSAMMVGNVMASGVTATKAMDDVERIRESN